jgi:integrase
MHNPKWPGLLKEKTRHNRFVWYVRVGQGPRVRLKAAAGTPEFRQEYEAAYAALVKGEKPQAKPKGAATGTLAWLWQQHCQSSAWGSLKLSTRRGRENIMKHVLATAGHAPLHLITKEQIAAGREARANTPSAANNYLNAMRSLFEWAVESGHMKANPAGAVKTVKRPKKGGYPEWTDEDVAAFTARWPLGTEQFKALAVHLYTGLRRGDAVRLGQQHFGKDGYIHITAEKNGLELHIPIHPKLVEAIQACPPSGLHILQTSRGRPWGSKEAYGNEFLVWSKAAGIQQIGTGRTKNSHGIRKLAATRVAEAGASEHELMALFGWTDPAMARVYTKAANQKLLAASAGAKVGAGGVVLKLLGGQTSIVTGSANGE